MADQPFDVVGHLASLQSAISASTLAQILSVSEKSIYKLAAKGIIPSFKIGASIRFSPAAVAAYLRSVGAAA
jgi:excisionase family DNA binding protein